MLRHVTNRPFKATIAVAFACTLIFLYGCSKSDQPASSNSSASAPSITPAASGGEFEGMIAMKMESEAQKGLEMTYFLKGRRTRIETKAGDTPEVQAVILYDLEAQKITSLIPSRKMYVTMDLKQTAEDLKQAASETKKAKEDQEEKWPKLTDTGRQETIAAHACQHWLMGDNQEIDMCVAKGLGYFGMGGGSGGGLGALKDLAFSPKLLAEASAHPEWVKFLEGGAFPLKITATENGKVTMNMEATRIEKKFLDDSLFAVPPDYKELNMGSVTGGKQ
jgi:hypothetical protein